MTKVARRRRREEQQGGLTTRGVGPPLAAPACGEATLAHYCHHPLAYIVVPENLSGGLRDRHHHLCGADDTEREKLSGRQKSVGEIPSRRGEIVAIVIIIALDFIEIIITIIIIITSTFIFTITTPSRCNILG
jgi:hypothetical protein